MQQQRLHLPIPARRDYGIWVRHPGVERACSRIALWLVEGGMLWLTSRQKAGKSHFVHALKEEHPHIGLVEAADETLPSFRQTQEWLDRLAASAYWVIDLDSESLSRARAIALFHLIERAREMNRPLLIVSRDMAEQQLPPELASRLRMLEQVGMEPPRSDDDLKAVLRAISKQLQWRVREPILDFMVRELPRDLASQAAAIEKLERASLTQPGRLTQAWAREHLLTGSD